MNTVSTERCDELRREWTDQFVKVNASCLKDHPELKRGASAWIRQMRSQSNSRLKEILRRKKRD